MNNLYIARFIFLIGFIALTAVNSFIVIPLLGLENPKLFVAWCFASGFIYGIIAISCIFKFLGNTDNDKFKS